MSKSKKHSAKANIHILNIEDLPIFIHWIQRVLPLYSVKHHLQPHEFAQICISEIAAADLSNPCRACSHRREKRSQWQNRPLSLPSPEPKAFCGLIIPIPSSHSKSACLTGECSSCLSHQFRSPMATDDGLPVCTFLLLATNSKACCLADWEQQSQVEDWACPCKKIVDRIAV